MTHKQYVPGPRKEKTQGAKPTRQLPNGEEIERFELINDNRVAVGAFSRRKHNQRKPAEMKRIDLTIVEIVNRPSK